MPREAFESQDERNAKSDGPKQSDLHATALRHANEAWMAEQENITNGRDDQRFYAGDQWPERARLARDKEHRPIITINRLPQFIRQVTGDIRKDTPSSKVLPAKDATVKKAEIFTGMIRNIEQQSNAKAAYVQGVDNACQAGIGAWRYATEYESDTSFDQVIRIKRIQDPFAVLFDPQATMPSKEDGRFAFVFDDLAVDEFKRQFPDKAVEGFPSTPAQGTMIWKLENSIRVAEYWHKEEVERTLTELPDGTIHDDSADEALPPAVLKTKPRQRKVKTQKVKQVLMSGKELLTEPQDWAGKYIPIVPIVGEEIRFEGRTVRRGMVRDARDPQQVYNYMRTAAVEAAALQPKAPFIGTVNQFKGWEDVWASAGSTNHAYLTYNPDPMAPGAPQRSQPALAQQGLDSQAAIAATDIEAVTGIYKANLGAPSNEQSGRAILARQKEGDTGTFFYVDNLRTALMHGARILLDLIPKIYDTPRVVRIFKEDGTHDMVPINQEPPKGVPPDDLPKEVAEALNDLTIGEYDVVVSTGPGYQTRREEARETVIELMRNVPAVANVAPDVLIRNLDIPAADEIAKRIEASQNSGPNPTQVAEVKLKAAQADKAEAEAEGAQIENISSGVQVLGMLQQLHTTMAAIQQQLAAGMPGATPPQPPPGPPPGAPPPNESPQAEAAEGPPHAEHDGDELVDMPQGAPV